MSTAPDFAEAVVGYRKWALDADGGLYPLGARHVAPWSSGQNEAVCHRFPAPSEGGPLPHLAPHGRCHCGLYAFRSLSDHQLRFCTHQSATPIVVTGAIAAWGEMEVHRTGFRAQYACVLALVANPRMSAARRVLLARAATRYGVPLVPWQDLEAEARRHAAPLPELLTRQAPRRGKMAAGREHGHTRRRHRGDGPGSTAFGTGYALDHHVWVYRGESDCVVGITEALARRLGSVQSVEVAGAGDELRQGEALAEVRAGAESLLLSTPLSGTVTSVNPQMTNNPQLLRHDPKQGGWLVRLVPSRVEQEARDIAWDPVGGLDYAAFASDRGDGILRDLRPESTEDRPSVSSWAELKDALLTAPKPRRFAVAHHFYGAIAERLQRRLLGDRVLSSELARLELTAVYRLHEPEASLTLSLADGRAWLSCGREAKDPDLVLYMSGDLAGEYWTGRCDPEHAVRRGDIEVRGDTTRIAALAGAVNRLCDEGAPRRIR